VIERMQAPLLVLGGGEDAGIPPADLEEFASQVRAAGTEVELVIYPGAPHSFFDRSFVDHHAACDDAWHRIERFLGLTAA
jgi:carboxymethylenebutenolidase